MKLLTVNLIKFIIVGILQISYRYSKNVHGFYLYSNQ